MPRKFATDEVYAKRIAAKCRVDKKTGCWLWGGAVSPGPASGNWAYGVITFRGRLKMAHRVNYELLVGPIPDGRQLDHLCRNTLCVNPAHLEPVTPKLNINRGRRFEAEKTHCPEGHPLSGKNLYLKKDGWRECRTCRKKKYREWVEKNRERRRELDRISSASRRKQK